MREWRKANNLDRLTIPVICFGISSSALFPRTTWTSL